MINPEWVYIFTERLAIMCGDGVPTDEQFELAKKEAHDYISKTQS